MANIFKDAMEKKEYISKVKFDMTPEESKKMFADLDNGKIVRIEGNKISELTIEGQGRKYNLKSSNEEDTMFLGPGFIVDNEDDGDIEEVRETDYPYQLDGKNKTIHLIMIKRNDSITVRKTDTRIIDISYKVTKKDSRFTLKHNIYLNQANNIKEIYDAFCEAYGYFTSTLKTDNSEVISLIRYYEMNMNYYKRVLELEEKIGKQFDPKEIENTKEEVELVEKLYFWIVKNEVIRSNVYYKAFAHAGLNNEESLQEGGYFDFKTKDVLDSKVYGETIKIYIARYCLNATIEKIEKKEKMTKLYFTDYETNPMIIAEKGFLKEAEVDEELNKDAENIRKYGDAMFLGDLSSKYLNEETKLNPLQKAPKEK